MNIAVLNQPKSRRTGKDAPKTDPRKTRDVPVWDPANGPDHSTVRMSEPARHTKPETPADYKPARNIPEPPEKSSGRSTCYYIDPIDFLAKEAEGQLELNVSLRYLSDPNVIRIEPQYGPVWYLKPEGKRTYTVFDQRIQYADRTKTVVAVKPFARSVKLRTDALNALVLNQMPVEDADRVQLVTERDLPQWALANFRLFHSVRNDRHWHCYGELLRAARSLVIPLPIDDFAKPWGGSKAVFRTVALLIFEGALRQVEPGEIDDTTMIIGGTTQGEQQ
ncbi:hypothetical protein [Devosia naphthalenivorans]|uniref:hypothetical protein n=1 Tax=Devosia naphthalenivorans TaxID=2082392 RepID=UPI000D3D6620|nr:hypothetical protein [Devosia naphthalenivorans]